MSTIVTANGTDNEKMMRRFLGAAVTCFFACIPHLAICQTADLTADQYTPATPHERASWIVDGVVGPKSLYLVAPLGAALQTAYAEPPEWQRSWTGFEKRYLHREADVAISNSIEAGLGAWWGEEPRYVRSGRHGIGARAKYAIAMAFVTQRRDGHLAPAWGRYAGNTVNNFIENAWLPARATTPRQTVVRSALGFLTRIGGNAWEEFWPDVKKKFHRP